MKINHFFKDVLGATPKNSRWSWGAVDPVHNRIFLRVWEDDLDKNNGIEKVKVFRKNPRRTGNFPGRSERRQHVNALKNGAQGFGIVCKARDPNPQGPRTIESFLDKHLLRFGEMSEDEEFNYAIVSERVSVNDLMSAQIDQNTLAEDLETILSEKTLDQTTKKSLVDARIGQGKFRSDVLQKWNNGCAVTGSFMLKAIRASHIKPWRNSSNHERLDPNNGLPLTANLDALFDAGLISFESDGHMLVSPTLSAHELGIYGLDARTLSKKPSVKTVEYLLYHKTEVFDKRNRH